MFDGPHTHDITWGRDFLHKTGMTLDFEQKIVKWMDKTIPMKPKNVLQDETFLTLDEMHPQAYFFCKENGNFIYEWEDCNPIDESMFNNTFNPWEPNIKWESCDETPNSIEQFLIDEAKYEETSPETVAINQHHLSFDQRKQLATVLQQHTQSFSGESGKYPHTKTHLEVKPD